jgi:2',3'-cyclic-nucleotide 2'-phosphodiesterase (5'-nucleotidase family)
MSADDNIRDFLQNSLDPILAPIIQKLVIAQPQGAEEIRRAIAEIAMGGSLADPKIAAAAQAKSANLAMMSGALPRPATAVGEFLRIITVNDCYKLDHYPRVATAIQACKNTASSVGCKVVSHMNGDFLAPCIITALDGGTAMMEALNVVGFDYACLGNHELDLGFPVLSEHLKTFKGKLINSNVKNPEMAIFPKYDTYKVGDKTVVVGGWLTDRKSIFPPHAIPDIDLINESIFDVWEQAKKDLGCVPDLFLPMTHQLTPEDKETGNVISKNKELKTRTPIILAAHDHEVYIDEAGASTIVKVGMDCEQIGIVDIWWSEDGKVHSSITMRPAEEWPADPVVSAFVAKQEQFIHGKMDNVIHQIPGPMSSKNVRFGESDMATFLMDMIKTSSRTAGPGETPVEIVMLQGGAVRAGKEYEAGPFTVGGLFQELAFDCHQAVVKIPGNIISESVKSSRTTPKPAPNFLHLDSGCKVNDAHEVTHIDGKPIEMGRMYTVSVYQFLLSGLNIIQPLLGWAEKNLDVPDCELCMPVKDLILKHYGN